MGHLKGGGPLLFEQIQLIDPTIFFLLSLDVVADHLLISTDSGNMIPRITSYNVCYTKLLRVDFGFGQGRSDWETAGVAGLRRGFPKSENTGQGQKISYNFV